MKSILLFLQSEKGVTSVEYGVLAAGLAVAIGALVADGGVLQSSMQEIFQRVTSSVPTAGGAGAGNPGG